MLKLACFTDEISQELDHALAVCNEYNLDAVELRSAWGHGPHNFTPDEKDRIHGLVADSGLAVACIAAPFFKCDLGEKGAYRDHLEILRDCIALGRGLGARIIRGFTFWRTRDPDSALFARIAEQFREPVRILESEGAVLGIENESSCHVGSAEELRRLLDAVGSPCVQAIWDPSNQVYMPDPTPLPFPDSYELIKGDIAHVHVKDAVRRPDGDRAHVPVGDGDANWPAQFAALEADGYTGYCSLETHWRPSSELTEELMNRPGGERYTAGAEAGSRVCLENIARILGRA